MKSVITYLLFVVGLAGAFYAGGRFEEAEPEVEFCIDGGSNGTLHIEAAPMSLVTRLSDNAYQIVDAKVDELFKVAEQNKAIVPCPVASPSPTE